MYCGQVWRQLLGIYGIIRELPWITIFWSRVRWRSHEWKSLANHITSDPKIVFQSNKCFILYLTCYFMSLSWTHDSNQRTFISQLMPRTAFSDLTLWCPHSWSVTSSEHEVLVLWHHIHQLFLHTQIGAKVIFTSKKQPQTSISPHPLFTA